MNNVPIHSELDRYLDGAMSAGEREAFERALTRDAGLRREVEAQRAVDAALTRAFGAIPSVPALALGSAASSAAAGVSRRLVLRWSVAAAALAAAGVGGYFAFWPRSLAERLLAREVSAGMVPTYVCVDDAQLRQYTQSRFGTALTLVDMPATTQIIGWKYGTNDDTPASTGILLAKAEGEPVVVLIDRADRLPKIYPKAYGDVQVFRAEIGKLAFLEISKSHCAKVAHRFRAAEKP